MKPPPASRKPVQSGEPNGQQRIRKAIKFAHEVSVKERLLKGLAAFSICYISCPLIMSFHLGNHCFCWIFIVITLWSWIFLLRLLACFPEFSCSICHQVMTSPMSTPCGHNFCMACLHGFYADKSFVRERVSAGGRKLRTRKIVKKCPLCPTDISDFLQNPQVSYPRLWGSKHLRWKFGTVLAITDLLHFSGQ